MRVGLTGSASSLPVRPIDFDDVDPRRLEMTSQARAVTAGPFHTDQHDITERAEPLDELAITIGRRRERRSAQQAAVVVQRGGDMHLEMGVDPANDLCSHIRVFSFCVNQ